MIEPKFEFIAIGSDHHLASLADSLLKARHAAGITQEELAEVSGISVRTISDIETGRVTRPRHATIRSIALALNIDLEEVRVLNLISRSHVKGGRWLNEAYSGIRKVM